MPDLKKQEQTKSPVAELLNGIVLLFSSATFVLKAKGLKRYLILPVLLNTLLYCLIIGLAIWGIYEIDFQVSDWDFWGAFGAWLAGVINWVFSALKWIIAIPALFVLCYFTFVSVGMVVASPLNDKLAQKAGQLISLPPIDEKQAPGSSLRGVFLSAWDSFLIVCRQGFFSILALPFLLVPLIGFLPLFFVTAYFTGIGFLDYSLADKGLSPAHKKIILRDGYWKLLGIGMGMELLFLIPFAGIFLMPLGTVAAAKLYSEFDWERAFKEKGIAKPEGFEKAAKVEGK